MRNSALTTNASPSTQASTRPAFAVARKLLTLVFYALRDGEVRCLETAA